MQFTHINKKVLLWVYVVTALVWRKNNCILWWLTRTTCVTLIAVWYEMSLTNSSISFKYFDKNVLYISHELCSHFHDSHGTAIRHTLTLRQRDSCGILSKFIKQIFINPKLTVVNYEKVIFPEACESVRGFSADVARYREVLVTGRWYCRS
jgi:hypothetical protein